MKYIKLFEYYNSIDDICYGYGINDYIINNDHSVDIYGDIYLSDEKFHEIPLKFNKIDGDFILHRCFNVINLTNGPKIVNGNFDCEGNKLESLEGFPNFIGGYFDCENNNLKTLKYMNSNIDNYIEISHNPLPSEIYQNEIYLRYILDNQEEYKIWNKDNSLNVGRFYAMMGDV